MVIKSNKKDHKKYAIIAGSGNLPKKVAENLLKEGKDFLIIGLEHFVDKDFISSKKFKGMIKVINLGKFGAIIKELKKQKVYSLVIAGGVKRLDKKKIKPDLLAVKLLSKLALKSNRGDNALSSLIVKEVEKSGVKVKLVHQFLPQILVKKKFYTNIKPGKKNLSDIRLGKKIARTIGDLDIGQSCIVQDGVVVAVEGVEGTAALIERSKGLLKKDSGAVLVKMKKPSQETKMDIPTIGLETVRQAWKSGLKGIVIDSEMSYFLNQESAIKFANERKMFIIGS